MIREDYPRPAPGPLEAPFWDGCKEGELRIQRCEDCGTYRHHPRPRCPECGSANATWSRVRGRGEVWTWTICHPPVLPAFAERAPYNAVVVRLEEGPFLVSNLVGVPDDELAVGMPVEVTFVAVDDELTIPQFTRVG